MPADSESSSPESTLPPPLTPLPADHWDTVFGPEPELARPGRFFGGMFQDFLGGRELAWRLFLRNIKAQYRQTFLGWFWAFAPIIVTTATFVFLQRRNILNFDEGPVPYPVYLFAGMILWQTFYEAVLAPIRQVTQAKNMLAKIHFPREALILAGFYETLFNAGLRLLLWVPAALYLRHDPFAIGWLFFPGFFALIGLGIGIGVLLVPLAALYQDVEKGLPVLLNLGLFLTPVLYPMGDEPARLFFLLNPATAILDTARSGLLGVAPALPLAAAVWTLVVIGALAAGWILFRLGLPHIISRMPAS
ncbi:MAG: ABC transporter permease [Opitutales bacterium]|nr:ABC transporter permease [Opitutales bacterium]